MQNTMTLWNKNPVGLSANDTMCVLQHMSKKSLHIKTEKTKSLYSILHYWACVHKLFYNHFPRFSHLSYSLLGC